MDNQLESQKVEAILAKLRHKRAINAKLRATMHEKPPEELATKLVNYVTKNGPTNRSQLLLSGNFTRKALDVAHKHAETNKLLKIETKYNKSETGAGGNRAGTWYSLPEETSTEGDKAKYKVEQPVHAHPAIAGFELEHYLRAMADKYHDDPDVPALVHSILTGGSDPEHYDPSGLHALNDKLQELDEPTATTHYNLHKAASDLHLDNAMNKILNNIVHMRDVGIDLALHTPETRKNYRRAAIRDLTNHMEGYVTPEFINPAKEGINILLEQGHTPEDIKKSLNRHRHKTEYDRPGTPNPHLVAGAMQPADRPDVKNRRYTIEYEKFISSIPVKYRHNPSVSSFIQAIRQLRSRNQEVKRVVPFEQYRKLGLKVDHILDSVADTPHNSIADTAHVIDHDGNLDNVRAAVALVAQQLNTPSYLAMHEHKGGPDTLYQFDVHGSADDFRTKLNAAGIRNRNFIKKPDNTGWWAMVYDKGNHLQNVIGELTNAYKLDPKISFGTGEFISRGEQAQATKQDRQETLSGIRHFEKTGQYPTDNPALAKHKNEQDRLKYHSTPTTDYTTDADRSLMCKLLDKQQRDAMQSDTIKPHPSLLHLFDDRLVGNGVGVGSNKETAITNTQAKYFIADINKVLKYGQDDVNTILKTMTHNDFVGGDVADHTKRGVLADAWQELGHPEAEDEAQLIRSGKPFMMHNGVPMTAVQKFYMANNNRMSHPDFHKAVLSNTQAALDDYSTDHNFHGHYMPFVAQNLVSMPNETLRNTLHIDPTTEDVTHDSKGTGFIHLKDKNDPNKWHIYKSVLLSPENANHTHINRQTGRTELRG